MYAEETLGSNNPDKQVIMACIFLSNALKSAYGQKGTEMARRMVDAIDPDLKTTSLRWY